MEAGEKELRKTFEDVTTSNVLAILAHGNDTRKMMRELEGKISNLENTIQQQATVITQLRGQLVPLQTAVYRGGTV